MAVLQPERLRLNAGQQRGSVDVYSPGRRCWPRRLPTPRQRHFVGAFPFTQPNWRLDTSMELMNFGAPSFPTAWPCWDKGTWGVSIDARLTGSCFFLKAAQWASLLRVRRACSLTRMPSDALWTASHCPSMPWSSRVAVQLAGTFSLACRWQRRRRRSC